MTDIVKRIDEYRPFEKLVLVEIYERVKNSPKDGIERRFTGTYTFKDTVYDVLCDYKLTAEFIKIYRLHIELEGKIIYTTDKPKEAEPIYQEIYL